MVTNLICILFSSIFIEFVSYHHFLNNVGVKFRLFIKKLFLVVFKYLFIHPASPEKSILKNNSCYKRKHYN